MAMPHPDVTFQGKRVSWSLGVVYTYLSRIEGISFRLNSGRRTKAEQEALIREKGIWSLSNIHGAAAYSPTAPHIAEGKQNHASDIDSWNDGENKVQKSLQRKGLEVINNVPGEVWHQQIVSEDQLIALAERLHKLLYPRLYKGIVNREATKSLQQMLRAKGYRSVIANGRYDVLTRIAVRKFQRKNKLTVTEKTHVSEATWKKLRGWS